MTHRMTRLALAVVLLVGAPATANASADTYQWAALGDSYTAGVFVGEPQPTLGAEDRDGCDRTTYSYPDLVDQQLAEFPPGREVELTDYSCGGAEIRHIAGEDQRPVSPVDAPQEWPLVSPQVQRAGLNDDTDVVTVDAVRIDDSVPAPIFRLALRAGHAAPGASIAPSAPPAPKPAPG